MKKKPRYISKDQVEHVAWLARIELSKDEKDLFARQFNDILTYFQKISEIDTSKVEPTRHILDIKNVFREDAVKPSLPAEEVLRNAPRIERRFFKAPRIM